MQSVMNMVVSLEYGLSWTRPVWTWSVV